MLVSFQFRSSQTRVQHNDANFGIRTLVEDRVAAPIRTILANSIECRFANSNARRFRTAFRLCYPSVIVKTCARYSASNWTDCISSKPVRKADIQFNFCFGEAQSSDAHSAVKSAVSASNLAIRSRKESVHRFNSSDN